MDSPTSSTRLGPVFVIIGPEVPSSTRHLISSTVPGIVVISSAEVLPKPEPLLLDIGHAVENVVSSMARYRRSEARMMSAVALQQARERTKRAGKVAAPSRPRAGFQQAPRLPCYRGSRTR